MLRPVESSAISFEGYDPNTKIMVLVWNTGSIYRYHGVPPELEAEFWAAESKGAWVNQNLKGRPDRKGRARRAFRYSKLDPLKKRVLR